MINRLRLKEKGDTIVEVLISLAILTLALGGAYYTADTSYRNDRASQEHSQALTVAQTQLEDLRSYIYSSNSDTFNQNDEGCFQIQNNTIEPNTSSTCYIPINSTTVYPTQQDCLAAGAIYCYDVKISGPTDSYIGTTTMPITVSRYEIDVNWEALGGGTDVVTLYYRAEN